MSSIDSCLETIALSHTEFLDDSLGASMSQILDGKATAAKIEEQLVAQIASFTEEQGLSLIHI